VTPDLIDWPRTKAWGEGGYYARVFLNVEGREPEGSIPPEDVERARNELRQALEALGDEEGTSIGTRVHFPDELYADAKGVPPDLLVYFGDLSWRSAGTVGGPIHLRENDTGPDDANHAHEGLYVLVADGVPAGPGPQRALHDVAPTLLELLGEPVPAEMEGQSMLGPPAESEPGSSPSRDVSVTDTRTLSR
jgi:predicted AlkP superfamily phosphohydrolase/phosphomutase